MKVQNLTIDEAMGRIVHYPKRIVYYYDRLVYGENNDAPDVEHINEAFFFNEEGCVHLFRNDGICAVVFTYDESDGSIEEEQLGAANSNVKTLTVRKIINYDDDGQAYISHTLPYKMTLRKGEAH